MYLEFKTNIDEETYESLISCAFKRGSCSRFNDEDVLKNGGDNKSDVMIDFDGNYTNIIIGSTNRYKSLNQLTITIANIVLELDEQTGLYDHTTIDYNLNLKYEGRRHSLLISTSIQHSLLAIIMSGKDWENDIHIKSYNTSDNNMKWYYTYEDNIKSYVDWSTNNNRLEPGLITRSMYEDSRINLIPIGK